MEDGHDWEYILAFDTGFRDDDAFAVVAYSLTCKTAYVVETCVIEKKFDEDGKEILRGFSDSMEMIRSLNDVYRFKKVVFDPTSDGHKIAQEIRRRYGIRMDPAEKVNKQAYISLMNDDLRTGRLKVVEPGCKDLLHQWDNLTWEYKADGTRVPGTKIGSVKMDHEADAALYAWRTSRHFMAKEADTTPEEGTEEWAKFTQRKLFEDAVKQAKIAQAERAKRNSGTKLSNF
jgi:hypothetical protein